MLIIRPETLVRWHCAGFHGYGAESLGSGRPPINTELRTLIRQMSLENLLGGAAFIRH
jgi:hypothetical protein